MRGNATLVEIQAGPPGRSIPYEDDRPNARRRNAVDGRAGKATDSKRNGHVGRNDLERMLEERGYALTWRL
jgi:hypothetical protein